SLPEYLLFLLCRDGGPVILPQDGQPVRRFAGRDPDRCCMFPVPQGIVEEIEKDRLKDRICIHLKAVDLCLQGYFTWDAGAGEDPGEILPPGFSGAEILVDPGKLNMLADRPC